MQMPFLKFICTKLQRKYSYGSCLDEYFSGGRLRTLPAGFSTFVWSSVARNPATTLQTRSHNEANEAVASPKISKKNLPQMKNS